MTALFSDDPFVAVRGELISYVEQLLSVSSTQTVEASATVVAITSSVALDGLTSVLIEARLEKLSARSGGGGAAINFWEGHTDVGRAGIVWQPTAMWVGMIRKPAPGSYAYSVRLWGTQAGLWLAEAPSFVRVSTVLGADDEDYA